MAAMLPAAVLVAPAVAARPAMPLAAVGRRRVLHPPAATAAVAQLAPVDLPALVVLARPIGPARPVDLAALVVPARPNGPARPVDLAALVVPARPNGRVQPAGRPLVVGRNLLAIARVTVRPGPSGGLARTRSPDSAARCDARRVVVRSRTGLLPVVVARMPRSAELAVARPEIGSPIGRSPVRTERGQGTRPDQLERVADRPMLGDPAIPEARRGVGARAASAPDRPTARPPRAVSGPGRAQVLGALVVPAHRVIAAIPPPTAPAAAARRGLMIAPVAPVAVTAPSRAGVIRLRNQAGDRASRRVRTGIGPDRRLARLVARVVVTTASDPAGPSTTTWASPGSRRRAGPSRRCRSRSTLRCSTERYGPNCGR